MSERMEPPNDSPHDLLGKRVTVTLAREGPDGPAVIVTGKLLAFDEWGEVVVMDDMGGAHYCWPRLDIAEVHE